MRSKKAQGYELKTCLKKFNPNFTKYGSFDVNTIVRLVTKRRKAVLVSE